MSKGVVVALSAVAVAAAASVPGIKNVLDTVEPQPSDEPQVMVGNFTYEMKNCVNSLSEQMAANAANLYAERFETQLVNNTGVRVGVSAAERPDFEQFRREQNELNQGRGGLVDGEYRQYDASLPLPEYQIDGEIVVVCCDKEGEKQTLSFTSILKNLKTGEVTAELTSETEPCQERITNYVELGPKPSLWERFWGGYTRETSYDDLLNDVIKDAARFVEEELASREPEPTSAVSLPQTEPPQETPRSTPSPTPTPVSMVEPEPGPVRDICCLNPKAKIGERYYIPFVDGKCLEGDQEVPMDENCANPLEVYDAY